MIPSWSRRWAGMWLSWLTVTAVWFFALEAIGLTCENRGIASCSTLSSWMVATGGLRFMVAATIVIAVTLIGHWWMVWYLQRRGASKITQQPRRTLTRPLPKRQCQDKCRSCKYAAECPTGQVLDKLSEGDVNV